MIFYFIPFSVIALIIIAILAVLRTVALNAVGIIFVILLLVLFLFALIKWPKATLIILFGTICLAFAVENMINQTELTTTPVWIFRATSTCTFYDESDTKHTIPEGALVARYTHPTLESTEAIIGDAMSERCDWYDGTLHRASVSYRHSGNWASHFNVKKNIWNLSKIKEITYRTYTQGRWWESISP